MMDKETWRFLVNRIDQLEDSELEEINRRLVVLRGELTDRFARADLDRAIRLVEQERITRACMARHQS